MHMELTPNSDILARIPAPAMHEISDVRGRLTASSNQSSQAERSLQQLGARVVCGGAEFKVTVFWPLDPSQVINIDESSPGLHFTIDRNGKLARLVLPDDVCQDDVLFCGKSVAELNESSVWALALTVYQGWVDFYDALNFMQHRQDQSAVRVDVVQLGRASDRFSFDISVSSLSSAPITSIELEPRIYELARNELAPYMQQYNRLRSDSPLSDVLINVSGIAIANAEEREEMRATIAGAAIRGASRGLGQDITCQVAFN